MSGSVSTWIKQLADGDSSAAAPLHRRFFKRINVRAKKLLRGTGLVTLDYEDVSQRVIGDMLMDIMRGQAKQVVNRRMLWRILEKMTYARTIDFRRREIAKKRNGVSQPVDLEEIPSDQYRGDILSQFEEELERVSRTVDQDAKSMIDLLRQGFGIEEIAEQFEVSPRTIHRKLAAIKDMVNESLN